jgi:hypothetical protein
MPFVFKALSLFAEVVLPLPLSGGMLNYTFRVWYFLRDSNPDFGDFKTPASAYWAKKAWRVLWESNPWS